jgi:PAS domain S-box-containing protein
MRRWLSRFDVRVSLIYAVVATAWILGSDLLVSRLFADQPAWFDVINTLKGLGFVVVTALVLYAVMASGLRQRRQLEQILQQEREISPIGMTILAPSGEITFANEHAERVLGLTRSSIVQQTYNAPLWKITDYGGQPFPDDQLPFVQVMATRRPVYGVQHAIEWPDGQRVLLEVNAAPVVDAHGNIREVIATLHDVTRTHEQTTALAEREQSFRLLFMSNPLPMWVYDLESLAFLEVNDAAIDQYGYSRSEFLAMRLTDIRPAEDVRRLIDELSQPRPPLKRSGEWRHRTKDGRIIDVEIVSHHLTHLGRDAVLVMALDVTARKQALDALRESEEKLRLFIDHAPAALAMFDRDMRYLAVSQRWLQDYHLGDQAILSQSHYAVFPEIPERWRDAHRRGMNGEVLMAEADEFVRADGSMQWLRWEIRPWHTSDGSVGGIVIFTKDITDRKLSEIALRASEERYRMLVEQAADGIYLTDQEGRILQVNARACDMLGRTQSEMLSLQLTDLVPAQDLAAFPLQFDELRAGRILVTERRLRHKNGSLIPVDVSARMLPDGHIQGIVHDISQRRRAEAHIRYLAGLIDSISDAIISTDESFIVRSWNKAAEALYGWTADEVIGQSVNAIVPTTYPSGDADSVLAAFRAEGLWKGEVIQPHRSGTPIHIAAAVSLTENENGIPAGAVAINRDITERKRAERMLRDYNQRLTLLHQIDRDILSARSPQVIAETVLRHLRDLIGVERASLTLFDESTGTAVIYATNLTGETDLLPETRVPLVRNRSVEILESGQTLVIPDLLALPEPVSEFAQQAIAEGIRATLLAPVMIQNRLLGHLSLATTRPNPFRDEHIEIAGEIANQLAIAFQNARLLEAIQVSNHNLQTLSARLVDAQESERRHIAHELHDEVGQTLTALSLMLKRLSRQADSAETAPELSDALALVSDLTKRIRELSLDLRPSMLDDLGLIPTLLWYFQRYLQQTGITIDFKHSEVDRRFPPIIETTVYRIIQEALTNVARYAQVTAATVRLWAASETLLIQIEDAGVGFDLAALQSANKTGGLIGMHERVQLVGGRLEIESNLGSGTLVNAYIPLSTDRPGNVS